MFHGFNVALPFPYMNHIMLFLNINLEFIWLWRTIDLQVDFILCALIIFLVYF